jgi:acetyltransferase
VSFLSQSGGIGLAFKGKASDEGLGISKWIGVGNRVNLEFETLLQYFADDPHTDVIGIFTEGSSNPRAFVNQIRAMSSRKPVVVYKGGRGEGADHITASHTGALAGSNRIWEGALAQAGAEIVGSASEMITVCKALALGRTPAGKRMGIFTHTAGPSIVAWDVLQLESDCSLADLESTTYQKIGDVLGPSVPVIYKNPVDGAGGAFLTKPFHDIAEIMLQDPNMDALLAIFCEHKNWQYPSEELISLAHQYTKTIVACFIGSTQHIEPYRTHMHEAGIPTYVMPEDAARGLLALLRRTS